MRLKILKRFLPIAEETSQTHDIRRNKWRRVIPVLSSLCLPGDFAPLLVDRNGGWNHWLRENRETERERQSLD